MSPKKLDLLKVSDEALSKKFLEQYKDDGTLDTLDDSYKQSTPILQLCQGASGAVKQGNARPGEFWDANAEKAIPAPITVTPLLIFNNRLRWSEKMEDSMPLCRSRDSETGEGDPGGECRSCEFKKVWRNGGMVGDCDEQVTMIVYVWDTATVTILNFARSKIKVAKRIVKLLNVPPMLKIFCYAFKLNTQLERSNSGIEYHNIYLDKLDNNDKITVITNQDKKLGEFAALYETYRDQYNKNQINTQDKNDLPTDNILKDDAGNEIF